ncbi:hypothetical protein ACFVZW_06120 [Streptomyces sp. NPDC059567]|uniref:hypothetical protein n=1 Tax=Streptomyces sp. NPDC059567 TaxID=3346867 RepID=UPI0036CFAAD2
MSAPDERGALTPRPSLYDYALRLHRAEPDGRLPEGGYPSPDRPSRPRSPLDRLNARRTAVDALTPFLTDPDTVRAADEVQRRLDELGVRDHHIRWALADLPLEDQTTARALGRRLTRTGTSGVAVCLGIGLLARLGEPEDIPYLRTLGLLRDFMGHAVEALAPLDRAAAALVALAVGVTDQDTDGPWLQFVWSLPEGDTPPEARATAALTRLEATDPKTFAQVRGGSREHVEALGFPWPEGLN